MITDDLLQTIYPNGETRGWKYTIYSLDGDHLTICSTAADLPRPTKFEGKEGDLTGTWVLLRVGPATTSAPAGREPRLPAAAR